MATLTRRHVIKLHKAQADFCHSRAPIRGFLGGRGAGKSHVGALDMIRRARRGRLYLVCSPTYTMLGDTTLRTFQDVAREMGVLAPGAVKISPPPMIRLSTGAEILFRSADDPDRLRGPNFSGAWLDEASQMNRDVYDVVIAALRQGGERGWLSVTMTPKGFSHWTYEVFGRERPDVETFYAATKTNPFLPADFAHDIRLQYGDGLRSQQELDGRFVNVAGAEWGADYFPDDIWFTDWPEAGFVATALALDPSKGKDVHKFKEGREPDYSAYCWGAVDQSGTVWIDADLDNVRDITRMVQDGIGHYRQFMPMAFCIEINVFQELLAGEFIRMAKEANQPISLPLWGITNTESKETRIRTIGPHLAKRELRFRDTRGCRLLVQQLRDFPAGSFDDGPDALADLLKMLRYLISGHQEGAGQPKLLRA